MFLYVQCDVNLSALSPAPPPSPSPPCLFKVNGRDLTSCSHHEAVQTIKMAASPVVLVVRCRLESVKQGRKSSQAQPQHQQVGGAVGGAVGEAVGGVGGCVHGHGGVD